MALMMLDVSSLECEANCLLFTYYNTNGSLNDIQHKTFSVNLNKKCLKAFAIYSQLSTALDVRRPLIILLNITIAVISDTLYY